MTVAIVPQYQDLYKSLEDPYQGPIAETFRATIRTLIEQLSESEANRWPLGQRPNPCSGFSFNSVNLYGDEFSIKAANAAFHEASTIPDLRTSFTDHIRSLTEQLDTTKNLLKEAEEANECDRSKLIVAYKAMVEALRCREWMASGRGCYEWDDDRWYKEFGAAFDEIHVALEDLRKVAESWTNCPKTSDSVAQARIDLKEKLHTSEQAVSILRDQLDNVVWKKAISTKIFSEFKDGKFSDILHLLFEQQITPGKAAEAIVIRAGGHEPKLPPAKNVSR